ncbi:cupin domain-containing protein [Nocardioides sp. SOB44]|uniref:Cupin domain-containing protein n=1 Tax=Nocardioides cremeus TaxID=3058044 RepID=A0ABT8TPP3_9ACTN|nr:cupin domain-containing protein [Nocardioides cremeus]MDO3395914.1 cupin domain-containing protein [Nocardioides cremeus]
MTLQTPSILGPTEGEHWHFLNGLMSIKADGAQTDGAMTALVFEGRRGFGPPLHSHDIEEELFHVLEGEIRFTTGDISEVVGEGGTVFLPKQRPHQFQVLSATAKMFQVTTPAQFGDFVRKLGTPAESATVPEPTEVDGARVAEICAQFQIQVLGPPPPPLD